MNKPDGASTSMKDTERDLHSGPEEQRTFHFKQWLTVRKQFQSEGMKRNGES